MSTTPVIFDDGSKALVSPDKLAGAIGDGGKVATAMKFDDGSSAYVTLDKVHGAIGDGGMLSGAAPSAPAAPAEMKPYSDMNPSETYQNPNAGHFGFPLNDEQSRAAAMDTNIPLGAAKGAASTVNNALGAAQWLHNKTTPGPDVNVVPSNPELLKPAPNEKLGYGAEQAAEFLAPGGLTSKLGEAATVAKDAPTLARLLSSVTRGGIEAASTGGVEALHGGDAGDVTKAALAGASGPMVIEPALKATQSLASGLWGMIRPGSQPETAIFKGLKPGVKFTKATFNDAVDRAVPEVLQAEKQTANPVVDTQSLLDNIKQAKTNVYSKVDDLLQQADGTGATVDGAQAAKAAQDAIDAANVPVSKAQLKQVDVLKQFYGSPTSLQQTEDRLQGLNAQLDSFYSQSGVSQAKALKADPVMAAKAALADSLRSQVDEILTNVTGTGSAELKQTYGSLRKLEDVTARRIPVAERASPYGLPTQIATPHGLGRAIKGAVNLQPWETVAGVGEVATGRYMQKQNDANELIRQAFANLRNGPKAPPANLSGVGGLAGRSLAGSLSGSYNSAHDMDGLK
jgi:hypothetical protein